MWHPFPESERERLAAVVAAAAAGDAAFLAEHRIDAGRKGPFVVLNYDQFGPANPVSGLARGLVVDANASAIVSFPFRRFANVGEGHAAPVDLTRADLLEKMDGSMLAVSFPERDPARPLSHTRRMLSVSDRDRLSDGFDREETALLRSAERYVAPLRVAPEHVGLTLVFELIHKPRSVVTLYDRERLGLHLIGARDLGTLAEASEDELDRLAGELGVARPRRWPARPGLAGVVELLADFPDDYEGFVVRDPDTGERVKVKSPRYLARHRLLGQLGYRNLLPQWLAGETSEIAAYFPEAEARFAAIEAAFGRRREHLIAAVSALLEGHADKKSLALATAGGDVEPRVRSAAFDAFGTSGAELAARVDAFLRRLPGDRLAEALGLED